MLSLELEPIAEEPPPAAGVQRMVGTLGFAGQVAGFFNIHTTVDFGRIMAAGRLGTAPDEVGLGTDVKGLLAEITSIVGGNLKSALNEAGHACVLSDPAVTWGTDFTIKPTPVDRFERCAFRKDAHLLMAEIGLKVTERADPGTEFGTPQAEGRIPNIDMEKLSALDYGAKVSGDVIDLFKTLFSVKLEAVEAVSQNSLAGERNVSSVCFAGDATGIVTIHVDNEMARRMTANRLGMEPEEIEGRSEIEEMLGELSNIVGDGLKSALSETGLRCALSTPALTIGSDFTVEALNLERSERFAFRAEDHTVLVEIGVKISDTARPAPPVEQEAPHRVSTPDRGETTQESAGGHAPPAPPPPSPKTAARSAPEDFGLEILADIPVELTVELGRTKIPIHELLKLQPGSALKLAQLEGEPVDILANDVLIARGEVVVRNEKYGIRITEITRRVDRLRGLS
jgi:flagellar motor switch protein FliN